MRAIAMVALARKNNNMVMVVVIHSLSHIGDTNSCFVSYLQTLQSM